MQLNSNSSVIVLQLFYDTYTEVNHLKIENFMNE